VGDSNGNGSGSGNGGDAGEGAQATAQAPADAAARAEEVVARSLEQTRRWLSQRRLTAEVIGPSARLSTREWLVRSAFALFAVIAMGVVVFSALGLLNATEAISAMMPVSTLAAVIVGVYLGSGSS
jgi:hypothetical protein